MIHCMKNVRIHSFTGPYFLVFGLNKEIYIVNICIQSEYGKMRIRKNSQFGLVSSSDNSFVSCRVLQEDRRKKPVTERFMKTVKKFAIVNSAAGIQKVNVIQQLGHFTNWFVV